MIHTYSKAQPRTVVAPSKGKFFTPDTPLDEEGSGIGNGSGARPPAQDSENSLSGSVSLSLQKQSASAKTPKRSATCAKNVTRTPGLRDSTNQPLPVRAITNLARGLHVATKEKKNEKGLAIAVSSVLDKGLGEEKRRRSRVYETSHQNSGTPDPIPTSVKTPATDMHHNIMEKRESVFETGSDLQRRHGVSISNQTAGVSTSTHRSSTMAQHPNPSQVHSSNNLNIGNTSVKTNLDSLSMELTPVNETCIATRTTSSTLLQSHVSKAAASASTSSATVVQSGGTSSTRTQATPCPTDYSQAHTCTHTTDVQTPSLIKTLEVSKTYM